MYFLQKGDTPQKQLVIGVEGAGADFASSHQRRGDKLILVRRVGDEILDHADDLQLGLGGDQLGLELPFFGNLIRGFRGDVHDAVTFLEALDGGFGAEQVLAEEFQARVDEFEGLQVGCVLLLKSAQIVLLDDGVEDGFGGVGGLHLQLDDVGLAAGDVDKDFLGDELGGVVIAGEGDGCLDVLVFGIVGCLFKDEDTVGGLHRHREFGILDFGYNVALHLNGDVRFPFLIGLYLEHQGGAEGVGYLVGILEGDGIARVLEPGFEESGAGMVKLVEAEFLGHFLVDGVGRYGENLVVDKGVGTEKRSHAPHRRGGVILGNHQIGFHKVFRLMDPGIKKGQAHADYHTYGEYIPFFQGPLHQSYRWIPGMNSLE